ncbi:MAG: hypothetical protein Q9O62_08120 [Ardenticatenia bacterium]|nr:hypothetical protein [Ardenticatenia bacterium]
MVGLAQIRDLMLIILAIESFVVGVLLILVLWQVWQLVKLLRQEIIPLVDTTKDSVEQVSTTTVFVGRSVAAPFIWMRGWAAGVREAWRMVRHRPK